MNHSNFPWSPLGTLLVEKGLLSSAQLEWALAGQHRSGRLLGEILVQSGYVSALSLSFALAEQHGVELRPASNSAAATDPEPPPRTDARSTGSTEDPTWRPLGRLLVERGFASRTELDWALAEQERSGRRLGEILVAAGFLSGPSLALALAEQHGVEPETSPELLAGLQTVIKPLASGQPVYRVRAVVYEPRYEVQQALYESTNLLEAADFAFEFVEGHEPEGVEIQRAREGESETVWTYSKSRAAAAAASRDRLVDTFGFDPTRWGASTQPGPDKTP